MAKNSTGWNQPVS